MVSVTALNSASKFGVSVSLRSIIHSYFLKRRLKDLKLRSFRLLTEYHSFLCNALKENEMYLQVKVSVSLRSIIHSYTSLCLVPSFHLQKTFPSPYGVSFILIRHSRCIR